MPRLRNSESGVVVNVDDDLAGRLSAASNWVSVKAEKAEAKKPSRKSSE